MKKSVEVNKGHEDRINSGFYDKYMQGIGYDIGYKGLELPDDIETVLPSAIGIDLDSDGYDGLHLPCEDESQDFIFCSHMLEHVHEPQKFLLEWHSKLKIGGHLILLLPHCYLYERSFKIGGLWGACEDHKRIYTPARLLTEIEAALIPNTYRIVHFSDNDKNFNYDIGERDLPDFYNASFEIECVLKKIKKPLWDIK